MSLIKRYFVRCAKCGYEWMARTDKPARCALCNNPNINEPKKRLSMRERNNERS